jgi:hypothetical protein
MQNIYSKTDKYGEICCLNRTLKKWNLFNSKLKWSFNVGNNCWYNVYFVFWRDACKCKIYTVRPKPNFIWTNFCDYGFILQKVISTIISQVTSLIFNLILENIHFCLTVKLCLLHHFHSQYLKNILSIFFYR